MPPSIRFTGHAIVTADGMISDAEGNMPPELRNDDDWRRFQAALDQAVLVVLGRIGHRRHPNPGRRRLVLSRSVSGLASSPPDPLAHLWNPAGAELGEVLRELGLKRGTVAVTGGTGVFDHFLDRYDSFVLSEVHGCVLPPGRPCFSTGHPRVALATAGLVPDETVILDQEAGVTETVWRRRDR